MAFGGFGSTGFGATAPASPFGQTATPAFGASPATPFGAQPAAAAPSPFGAPAATPAFGQTTPAAGFGAASTPAFGGGGFGGATSSFGAQAQPATAFGAKPATAGGFGGGFGAATPSPSPFGAQATPAFGASTPAAGGFGAAASTSPFGGSSGLTSQPTFGGAASTSAFGGAAAPAFGAASPTPAFGGGGGMFGGGAAAAAGTRSVPYQPVNEQDHSTSGTTTRVNFHCISVMPQYNTKSMEELRWEDYSSGCKGNTGGAAPGGFGAAPGAFGSAAASSPFGAAAPAAASPFGGAAQPAFGASTPAFGAAATSSPFGAASTPAFGGQPQQQQPAFGATPTPAFGASTPAASPFGAAATPAFGAKPASPFGAASTTPAFGASPTPAPAFGASPTPAFGSTTPGAFGAAPATSQPAFGASGGAFGAPAASTGAFGAATPAFGATGGGFGATPGAFGATPTPFGAATSSAPAGAFGSTGATGFGATAGGTSLFGGTSSAFGAPQTSSAFGATSSPSLFGATPSAFGATTPASTGFGGLGGSPSLFGASAQKPGGLGLMPASGGAFSFAQTGTSPFGAAPLGSVAAATPPSIAQSPYGALPQAPSIGGGASATPNMKVGISQRPVGGSSATGTSSLITPRTIMPRSGVRMRARRTPTALQRTRDSVASSPSLAICDSSPASNIFTPRDNPRRLFIREAPPPASVSQPASSPSPAPARQGMQGSDPIASPATPGMAAQKQTSNGDVFDASNGLRGRLSSVHEGWSSGAAKDANGESTSSHLPKLTKEDYYMEPSLEALSSMARDDSGALKAVRAFTIGRHGFGQVQWLGLVDVRGLDLDKLVHIRSKALEVYPDDTDKPPVGSGLNKPATVTLQKIYKTDKSTGMPTTDEAAIKKFRRRLIEHSADQESKFVSYNPESGEWVFEVAHFSRYGLDDDDSDEDNDLDDADLQNVGVSRMPEGHVGHGRTVLVVEDEDDDQDKTAEVLVDTMESSDSDIQHADDMMMDDTGASSADELAGFDSHLDGASRPSAAVPLAHSLPSNLQLNVEELAGMQSSLPLHPDPDALGSNGPGKASDVLARRSSVMPGPMAKNAWTSKQNPLKRAAPQAQQGKSSTPSRALLPVPSAAITAFDGSPMVPPGGKLAALPAKLSSVGMAVSKTQSCVDIGLLLGRSFRVGWGPGGMLAVPSLALNHRDVPHAHVRVRKVATSYQRCRTPAVCPPEEDSDAAAARARARLVESMEVHKRFSSQVANPTGCRVPLRVLNISSQRPALSKVCNDFYTAALEAHNSTTSQLEKLVAAHQMGAWQLVLELFSVVDCRDIASGDSTAVLEGLRRRGMVSSLLRQLVRTTVQREVDSSDASEQLVMAWLTGHELGPAMAAAASCGDVRLATLAAATAAGNILGAGAASDQLKLWSSGKLEEHIPPSRLALYKLLAGDIPGASMGLALDWRRNMGLYMWYGMPATAGLHDVLQAYLQAVTDQKAAPPLPSYVMGSANSEIPQDAWFGLLCLQASLGQSMINDAAVKSLFFPASHTPDPLDHTFNWMLVGVLQDLGAMSSLGISPSAHSTSSEAWFRLASSVVAQAELLGEPLLAIYAACHIPDHPHFSGLRDTAVRKLLMRHAPEMLSGTEAEVADVTQRLCGDLGVPATWVAESMATWARHTGNSMEQLKQLILAESYDAAHEVLMLDVAPTMLHDGMFQELEALVAELLPHAPVLEGWHLGGSVYAEYLALKNHQSPSRLERVTALGSVLAKASTYWLAKQKAMRSYGYADGQRDCLAMALSQIADECASWAMADAALAGRFQGPGFALSVDAIPSQHRSYHIQAAVTSTAHAISSLG